MAEKEVCNTYECHHKVHWCKKNSFIWVNHSKKQIYFEVPKNASSTMKNVLKDFENMSKKDLLENYTTKYSDYFIFSIYRDFEERIISNYNDFIKSNKMCRIEQMSNLFKMTKKEVQELSITRFLELALKHKDHHWSSQYHFMNYRSDIVPEIYNIKNINDLLKKINVPISDKVLNTSKKNEVNLTETDRVLIRRIYEADYKNSSYFAKIL